jgi:hypothetical protein
MSALKTSRVGAKAQRGRRGRVARGGEQALPYRRDQAAIIHANVPPAPTDSDVPMPEHDRDEKGRMKLSAYLLTAHKAG